MGIPYIEVRLCPQTLFYSIIIDSISWLSTVFISIQSIMMLNVTMLVSYKLDFEYDLESSWS